MGIAEVMLGCGIAEDGGASSAARKEGEKVREAVNGEMLTLCELAGAGWETYIRSWGLPRSSLFPAWLMLS